MGVIFGLRALRGRVARSRFQFRLLNNVNLENSTSDYCCLPSGLLIKYLQIIDGLFTSLTL